MINEIRKQMERVPFEAFSVRTSDGREYSVPSVDHAYITPLANRVVVTDDEGTVVILGSIHISGVVRHGNVAG